MNIDAKTVKDLREKTGAGIMDCKTALVDAEGNIEKAIEILRKKGIASAQKKAGRTTKDGTIGSYIHFGGKIGVMIEVNCETDFVASTQDFQDLAKDLSMQIASAQPIYVSQEDVPEDVLDKEKEIYREQALGEGKPEKIVDRIIEGKLKSFYTQVCLLDQPFVKENSISIKDRIQNTSAKLGENITVKRFVRYQVGQE